MNRSFWHHVPMVRLLIPLAAGIISGLLFSPPLWMAAVLTVTGIFGLTLFVFATMKFQWQWLTGVFIHAAFAGLGLTFQVTGNELFAGDHFSKLACTSVAVRIDDAGLAKKGTIRYKACALGCSDASGRQYSCSGNLILYLDKKNVTSFAYGDIIVIPKSVLKEIPSPQNPGEFDYKRYMALNNIHYSAYISKGRFRITGLNDGSILFREVYAWQKYFRQVLHSNIGSANEAAVAEALLYGFDDDIDAETTSAYSRTGTLHVLAVSGMHVGIIFIILGGLLKFMDRNKRTALLKHIIILAGLWVYSLLCGLSPSILRATVMFSFIIIGAMLKRTGQIYNTLAASAFFLFCTDSNMIAGAGLQLSYLAVIGIVFLQPYIYEWWSPGARIADEVWKLTSVSFAAQIVTFPISLLYFQQFPNCFLVSNLLIIPLTTVMLYTGIVLLAVSKITLLASILGKALYYGIAFTNRLAKFIEGIPYSYTDHIYISTFQCIMLYITVAWLIAFFILNRKKYFRYFLVSLLAFTIPWAARQVRNNAQQSLAVYQVRHHTAARLISGTSSVLVADSVLMQDKARIKFHTGAHFCSTGIDKEELKQSGSWMQVKGNGKTIIVTGTNGTPTAPVACDVLIITSGMPPQRFDLISCRQAVITSAVPVKGYKNIVKYFLRREIPCHTVTESGAFELSL